MYMTCVAKGDVVGRKISVMVHDGPENARIVACKELTGEGRSAVVGLAYEVENTVAMLVGKLERMANPLSCAPSYRCLDL